MKGKIKKEEISQENGNLEIISPDEEKEEVIIPQMAGDEVVKLAETAINIRKKGGNIIIGTLNIVAAPVKKHLKNRHEMFYKESKFHLWADILFILAILGLAAIFIFIMNLEPKAEIALEAKLLSEKAVSGQPAIFEISYKNNGKTDIKNATLSLVLPKNFILETVNPENNWSDQTNTFQIGNLARGANGKVKISGTLWGEVGANETLAYSLNYLQNTRAGNTLGSLIFPLESSVLSAKLELPNEIYKGLDFSGKILIKNSSQQEIDKEISLSFEKTPFAVKSISTDKAVLINNAIVLSGLPAGDSSEIEFEAATDNEKELPLVFAAYLQFGGQKLKQEEASKILRVIEPKFSLNISADKKIIKNEETVNFKLQFSNQEQADISDIKFDIFSADSATLIKNFILKSGADKYQVTGSAISLGNLARNGSGVFDFDAVLSRKKVNLNQEAGIMVIVSYAIEGKISSYKIYSPKIKYFSDLQASSKAYYYSAQGDQLGIGPLPPIVNVPTRYWIFWEIDNFGNDLKNLTMSADLPANVIWTGQKSLLSGQMRYSEIGRKVVWIIGDLPKEADKYRASFEIELLPAKADLGTVPDILTNTSYGATDVFANQEISGSLPNLNADLKDDPASSGKGRVEEMKIIK